jgi:aspartate/tyrosine/aromatic aminotransferase
VFQRTPITERPGRRPRTRGSLVIASGRGDASRFMLVRRERSEIEGSASAPPPAQRVPRDGVASPLIGTGRSRYPGGGATLLPASKSAGYRSVGLHHLSENRKGNLPMLEKLSKPAGDEILQLASAFREDTRPEKLDLGIGVYRDALGNTPVMRAIKNAEMSLVRNEATKSYLGFAGDERFNAHLVELVLGDNLSERIRAVQTPGGGGAVRLIVEFIRAVTPQATVWLGTPTWINHRPILDHVGLTVRQYEYLDRAEHAVNFDQMMGELAHAARGDIVLLQGCCHNPSGADLSIEQWTELADLTNKLGLIPFIDIAYQGLGNGLDADARPVRLIASRVPELLVAVSCSKNFGVYRDRVGCAALVARSAAEGDLAKATLASLARVNYSFPPSHGASAVRIVLETPELKTAWVEELEQMRQRLFSNRVALAAALRARTHSGRFDFLTSQHGMFSLLGITSNQVQELRHEHAIFMPSESRINIAGLRQGSIDRLADALQTVIQRP